MTRAADVKTGAPPDMLFRDGWLTLFNERMRPVQNRSHLGASLALITWFFGRLFSGEKGAFTRRSIFPFRPRAL